MIRLNLLGPITIGGASDLPADLYWRKHLALLVYLAGSEGRSRSRAHLADLLWPEGLGARSLNQALVPLRRALGDAALQCDRERVQLMAGAIECDTTLLLAAIERRQWAEVAALVRGPFADGFAVRGAPAFDQWLTLQRSHWREVMVGALVRLAEELGERGDYRKGAEIAGRAIDLDPVHDPAMTVLLRLMALDDRPAAGVALLDAFTAQLRELTGRSPGTVLLRLGDRLRHRPRPPAIRPSRRAPLVGRGHQLAAAQRRWQQCRQERRATVLVVQGDPGCGRSRLIEELAAAIRLERATVAAVRLVRADATTPCGALASLVRGDLRVAPGSTGASPEALRQLDAGPAAAGRFVEALRELLIVVSDEQPLLLVLDDAQWCDPRSIELLEQLLRDLREHPILLVLSLPRHPPLEWADRLVSRMSGDLSGTVLSLEPFGLAEVATLAREFLAGCDEAQRDRIARRTLADSAGLPLLVIELLHAVALGLELGDDEAGWPVPSHTLTDTRPGDLPDTVIAAIRVGYRQLSAAARTLLGIIAVGDRPVAREQLESLSRFGAGAIDAALDELLWQRWIETDSRGYGFVSQVARQVVERDMLTPVQRQRLSLALAVDQ